MQCTCIYKYGCMRETETDERKSEPNAKKAQGKNT